jgi:hypothetical protein
LPENRRLAFVFSIKYTLISDNKCTWTEERREMAYKLDGAKFATIEELVEALYPLYADKMSEEEFKKYVEQNAEKS